MDAGPGRQPRGSRRSSRRSRATRSAKARTSPLAAYPHIIADSGKVETMMWVFERPDGGRSFGFTGGHTHTNWGDVNQRRVMLNALLWIAKVDVPARGVEDKITEADLTTNLDEKPVRR